MTATTLLDWALKNKFELGLVIQEHSWPKILGVPCTDVKVTSTVEGKTFVGHATDRSLEAALTRAIAESVERFAIRNSGRSNSNGIAVHTDHQEAAKRARLEAIERDGVFSHFKTGIPPRKLDQALLAPGLWKGHAEELARQHRIELTWYACISHAHPDVHVILVVANGLSFTRPFGIILASGAALTQFEAIEKAAREILPALGHTVVTSQAFVAPATVNHPLDHLQYGLDPNVGQKFMEWLTQTPPQCMPPLNSDSALNLEKLHECPTTQIFFSMSILNTSPLVCHAADLSGLTPLCLGEIPSDWHFPMKWIPYG